MALATTSGSSHVKADGCYQSSEPAGGAGEDSVPLPDLSNGSGFGVKVSVLSDLRAAPAEPSSAGGGATADGGAASKIQQIAERRETDGFIFSRFGQKRRFGHALAGRTRRKLPGHCQGGKVIAFCTSTERRMSKAGNNKGSQANWI